MEKQWLVAPVQRRSRTVFTVVGSILLHGSIIAVAALWPVRYAAPAKPPVVTDISDAPLPGELLPLPPSSIEAGLTPPNEPEPATFVADISTDTPTPTVEPEMTAPPPRPPSKTVVSKTRSAHPSTAVAPTQGQPGATNVSQGAPGVSGTGRPGAVGRWNTPQPPYPYTMRAARVQGSGSVRITTDGSGHVVSASVMQSTGNAALDANTSQFARLNWSGPPNTSVTVPITYQIR